MSPCSLDMLRPRSSLRLTIACDVTLQPFLYTETRLGREHARALSLAPWSRSPGINGPHRHVLEACCQAAPCSECETTVARHLSQEHAIWSTAHCLNENGKAVRLRAMSLRSENGCCWHGWMLLFQGSALDTLQPSVWFNSRTISDVPSTVNGRKLSRAKCRH